MSKLLRSLLHSDNCEQKRYWGHWVRAASILPLQKQASNLDLQSNGLRRCSTSPVVPLEPKWTKPVNKIWQTNRTKKALLKVRLSGASFWPSISSMKLIANCHCWLAAHAEMAALKVTALACNEWLRRLLQSIWRASCQRATRAQHVTNAFRSTVSILSVAFAMQRDLCQLAACERAPIVRVFTARFEAPPLLPYATTWRHKLRKVGWKPDIALSCHVLWVLSVLSYM